MRWACFIFGVLVCLPTPALASDRPLSLSEVLESALQSHPKMAIADAKVAGAEAESMQARGNFDLKLFGEGTLSPVGKYDKPYGEVGIKQPTTLYGLELYAKYQNGADHAPYDGDRVTSEAGKASLGALLPLLRGGVTDRARFQRKAAMIEVEIATLTRRSARAELLAVAAETWWKWVVTGKKLEGYRRLVQQAQERRDFLSEQAKVGAIAPVEVVDNERLLAARKAQLAVLELEFRRTSLKLGLYRRGSRSEPRPPLESELPHESWAMSARELGPGAWLSALEEAPALAIYERTLDVLRQELSLSRNEQLPELNLELFTTRSFGEPRPYSVDDSSVTETTVGGKLALSWDVQRRKARGKAGIVRAKQRVVEEELRLLRDQLSLEVQAQLAALEANRIAADLSRQATLQAEEVSVAERTSFEVGQSSVLSVNLREQAVISAYLAELDALFAYQVAWVELQRIVGRDEPAAYLPSTGASTASPDAEAEAEVAP